MFTLVIMFPAATRQRLVTDPHSMPEFRTNGVVRNMDAWYAAFDAKPGDTLTCRLTSA